MIEQELIKLGYTKTSNQKPPEGVKFNYAMVGGEKNNGQLVYKNGLYWQPDFSMYTYFTPDYWKV